MHRAEVSSAGPRLRRGDEVVAHLRHGDANLLVQLTPRKTVPLFLLVHVEASAFEGCAVETGCSTIVRLRKHTENVAEVRRAWVGLYALQTCAQNERYALCAAYATCKCTSASERRHEYMMAHTTDTHLSSARALANAASGAYSLPTESLPNIAENVTLQQQHNMCSC
eukprot:4427138-Pleurochrysis_carterae.AAC.2